MFCHCETLFLEVMSHRNYALLWPQQHGNDEYYHAEQSDDTIPPVVEQEPQVGLSMLSVKSKELEATPTITDLPDVDRGNRSLRKFGMITVRVKIVVGRFRVTWVDCRSNLDGGNYLQWKIVCTSGVRPTARNEMFGKRHIQ